MKIFNWLSALWCRYNPFDIDNTIAKIVKSVDDMATKIDKLHLTISNDIAELEYANKQKDLILQQTIDCLPDMVWFKDLDGKYVFANQAVKDNLLLYDNPIGYTDLELATIAKARYGENNFTFGEKCANSDKITLECEAPRRFLESGNIKGELVYLEVFKNVVRNQEGDIIGVCGTGRDLTEYVTAVKCMELNCAKRCGESDVVQAFKKYEFGEEQ